jgi:Right handed beta helix region
MSGSIQWTGKGGWIEGITFRRPKIVTGSIPNLPILEIKDRGKIDMIQCIFDNEPSTGPVVVVSGTGNKGHFDGVSIRNGKSGGVQMNGPIQLKLTNCMVRGNAQDGVDVGGQSSIEMKKCKVSNNKGFGLRFAKGSRGIILQSHFVGNAKGVLLRQSGCNLSCSTNTAIVSVVPVKQIPGFKLTVESKSYIPNEVPRSFAPHS